MQGYDFSSEMADLEGGVELFDEMLGRGVVPLEDVLHDESAEATVRSRGCGVNLTNDREQGPGLAFAVPGDSDILAEPSRRFLLQTRYVVLVSQAVHLHVHVQARLGPRVVPRPERIEAEVPGVGLQVEMLQHTVDHGGLFFGEIDSPGLGLLDWRSALPFVGVESRWD